MIVITASNVDKFRVVTFGRPSRRLANNLSKGFPWVAGTTAPGERMQPDRALRRIVLQSYCAYDAVNRWIFL